tara:strand:+ start:3131 stop:4255 length:1125 start_codon:yes stop_codon:yes gene_type:complete
MNRKILSLIVICLFSFGCVFTTGAALTTVGTATASKILQHSAGYGVQSPHTIIEKVMPTVATITVEVEQPKRQERGFVKPTDKPQRKIPDQFSTGSGFVISEDGMVVTNWHVIQNAINHPSTIRIGFSNHAQYEATIFNYDRLSDVAILKIHNEDQEKFKKIKWGSKPKLGGHAIVIGSPIGLDFSVSFGIISALDRTIPRAAPPFVPYIQTDAAMNSGNSGGPMFNEKGQVIGINTLILSPGATQQGAGSIGLGFAVDGQYVQDILKRLMGGDKIKWSYIGISYRLLDRKETKSNNLDFGENVIIMNVDKKGAAHNKLFVGDIVQKLDGEIVKHTNFASRIARKAPETLVHLDVLRNGQNVGVDITLLERKIG